MLKIGILTEEERERSKKKYCYGTVEWGYHMVKPQYTDIYNTIKQFGVYHLTQQTLIKLSKVTVN